MFLMGFHHFREFVYREPFCQIVVRSGGHLVKWLHCWSRQKQLCTSSSKQFTICIVYHIYTGSKESIKVWKWISLFTHWQILLDGTHRGKWLKQYKNRICHWSLWKMSPIRCHKPKISTLLNWKWTLSLAFGAHYCRMAAILENGCHGMKI